MQFIDLKYFLPIGHTSAPLRKEMDNHEYRQNRLCPTDGILSLLRIPEMRRAVRRKLQGEIVHLPGPVSLYGLRSAHVPGKPSGYRGLPAWSKTEAISHGHPEQGLQKYHCPCQRDARLANLRRLCPGADQDRERAVRRRGLRPGTGSDRIRLRFNDPRSLSLGLSVGHVPQGEGRDQAAYASGSPRQYPVIIRITPAKIHDVNILDDLLFEAGAIYIFDRGYVDFARLYRIHQSQALFLTRAKSNFVFKRLYSQPVDKSTGVRAETPTYPVLRFGDQDASHFSDQQLRPAGHHHRTALQMPLAGGAVLQMDQAAPADQGFLWHHGERSEDSDMDRHLYIRAVAIVKKRLKLDRSLYSILQILSVSLFEKTPILQVLSATDHEIETPDDDKQLILQL